MIEPFLAMVLTALAQSPPPAAEPAAPKPPAEYDVNIRYQIDAFRTAHVMQFDEMVRQLSAFGFRKAEGPEDERENRSLNRMRGTIASASAHKLLAERHVRTLLLTPRDLKLPPDVKELRLQLELSGGLAPELQHMLAEQVRRVLATLEFREAVGYDHRGHTRLVGMIPLIHLDTLFNELHGLPGSLALLKPTLLADLRRSPDGDEQLQLILLDLLRHPEGKKRLLALINERKEDTPAEQLLTRVAQQVRQGPAAAPALVQLFDDLRQGPASSELVRIVLGHISRSPTAADLPVFFKSRSPVRVIEVMGGMEPAVARPDPPPVPKELENVGANLRALLADKDEAAKPARLEVILTYAPPPEDRSWHDPLRRAAPGLRIDGRVGPLVSVQARPAQAPALAALPIVSTVRLALPARPQAQAAPPANLDLREALKSSGLEQLHGLGHRGKGVRAAVIDGDFRGWQEHTGKGLPAGTAIVDLTRAPSRTIEPDPFPGDPKAMGHGTRCALLLMQAAPEASLTLIRIDPSAPYQLQEAARFINGERVRSLSLDARADDLEDERQELELRRGPLMEERRFLLNTVEDPEEMKKRWDAYRKRQAEFDGDEQDYHDRLKRYLRLHDELRGLKGIHVVACPLVWNEGHPVDGSSALSRYFDDRPFKAALWFQSAGNTRGQAWTGLFRDADGNGVMEFTAPEASLPKGRWTPELSFLGWRPAAAAPVPEVPAGARLRVSIQWREAHDAGFLRRGEDAYRVPLAELRLVVLRQRDPSGTKLPVDDLEVVAESAGLPQRLDNQPSAGTYEQSVEFTAAAAGRYMVRVEGRAPDGIRPRGAPTVPAAQKFSAIRPRVFVETLQGPGRAIFLDFTSDRPGRGIEGGSLGVPADARQVITVGAADGTGQPQPYSAGGPPWNLDLLTKPDVLAYDLPGAEGSASGTSLATTLAAGLAASALSAGAPRGKFFDALQVQPGGILRIPRDWPVRGR